MLCLYVSKRALLLIRHPPVSLNDYGLLLTPHPSPFTLHHEKATLKQSRLHSETKLSGPVFAGPRNK